MPPYIFRFASEAAKKVSSVVRRLSGGAVVELFRTRPKSGAHLAALLARLA